MSNLILQVGDFNHPWKGNDPFLFCAYHVDNYPEGNGRLGINAELLNGRSLGGISVIYMATVCITAALCQGSLLILIAVLKPLP
ncbi:hypothetical protein [Klebsiella sp. 141203]|uniref:hypothetical protein n=1 Tax=Klebsiella sp. 141203 TaxID=3020035 RepID=UPI0029285B0D|nr:hypothetical protein [Klebsiella sp. 141203]MDU9367301.1 hypothetical protein [Klebsiella sp. 141203]